MEARSGLRPSGAVCAGCSQAAPVRESASEAASRGDTCCRRGWAENVWGLIGDSQVLAGTTPHAAASRLRSKAIRFHIGERTREPKFHLAHDRICCRVDLPKVRADRAGSG